MNDQIQVDTLLTVNFKDSEGRHIRTLTLPRGITDLFVVRVIQELGIETIGERQIWMSLRAHLKHHKVLERAEQPKFETSIEGTALPVTEQMRKTLCFDPDSQLAGFHLKLEKDNKRLLFKGFYLVDDIFYHVAYFLLESMTKRDPLIMSFLPIYYDIKISEEQVSDQINRIKALESKLGKHVKVIGRLNPLDELKNESQAVDKVFRVPTLAKNRSKIQFHQLGETEIPLFDEKTQAHQQEIPVSKGDDQRLEDRVDVRIHEKVYKTLIHDLQLSPSEEDGGYLVGQVFRKSSKSMGENAWVIQIEDVIPAHKSHGNSSFLLFTGDTWSHLRNEINRNYPSKSLLSWYHTHLFKADAFGLSEYDILLHDQFFKEPWQVALLINLDTVNRIRTLRCFQRNEGGKLIESSYSIYQ